MPKQAHSGGSPARLRVVVVGRCQKHTLQCPAPAVLLIRHRGFEAIWGWIWSMGVFKNNRELYSTLMREHNSPYWNPSDH